MNKHDFISLVESPQTLGKQHITSLRSVASDFPYFQTAQVLLAKALYNEKHYEFEKQLKHVSLMSPDRAVLFRFIHNIKAETVAEVPVPIAVETVIETPKPVLVEEIAAVEELQDQIIPEPVEEQQIDIPQAPEIIEVLEIAAAVPEAEAIIEVVIETPLAEAPEVIPAVEVPIIEDRPEATVSPSETHSFAEWLLMQQQSKIVEDASLPATPITPQPEPEPTSELNTLSMQEEIAQQVERSNVNEFESILDKFIRENPRISRAKAEFYNPVNMAKQSVEENDEIVTETLANVYYNQGHYKKAIRVYEKLCLIYPHKMSYFASLIQKIKTENKD